MDYFYPGLFSVLIVLAISLEFNHNSFLSGGPDAGPKMPPHFVKFRNNYLVVYSLMMAGDWLQGPYIYALYEHYGYKVGDIGRLFIAGFGSSMVFGTLVGALADTYGRRSASILYVITYSFSCVTKHSGEYSILLLGRLLGGISTSLLFSAFESWLVAEHNRRNFPEALLGDIFSKAVFLGAGLMAIISGLLGNVLVEEMQLGPVAPFDAAICVMLAGGAVMLLTWPENYGDNAHSHTPAQQFMLGLHAIVADRKIALLGAMQSLFEASMYTFVFLWTPALSPKGEKIPHGMVFSCFMTACMAGSALNGLLIKRLKPQADMPAMFLTSAAAMTVPFLFHMEARGEGADISSLTENGVGGISLQGKLQLLAFCLFEACVGLFWPSMMSLRAVYVPEQMRSTIMNIFRIPLNLFVCLVLYKVSLFPLSVMFGLCVVFLLGSAAMQLHFNALVAAEEAAKAEALAAESSADTADKAVIKASKAGGQRTVTSASGQ